MDLNRCLCLSPRSRSVYLASVNSLSVSSSTQESCAPAHISVAMESSNYLLPNSPSHASFSSDQPPVDDNPYVSYAPPLLRSYANFLPVPPIDEPDTPYSPLNEGENSHVPYDPLSPFGLIDEPHSPPIPRQTGEFLVGDDELRELLRCQEFGFQRLLESIEPNHRWSRRLRSSLPYGGEPSLPEPTTEQVLYDIMSSSETSVESTGKQKACVEVIAEKSLEEELEENNRDYFECNVCLDVAKEPVVTSCGHLFCWPCLYQWLHLHSDHKECPVCKGEVVESRITPIYGRGSSETSVEKKCAEGDSGTVLKIPPRHCGRRVESSRQQLQRPTLRRLREGIAGNSLSNVQSSSTSSLSRDGIDLWHRFSAHGLASTDRLAAITAVLDRAVRRFASSSNHSGASASASAVNPQNPQPMISMPPMGATLAADQAASSSTMALIPGDTAVTDDLTEPNSGGSSRSHRRRGWSSISGSLDVDGALPARKRRL